MKIKEGIKLKGRGVEIPDCSRRHLPEFFKEMGYKVGVEVGVQRGAFSRRLLKVGLKVYAVDPWLCYPDYDVNIYNDYQAHQDEVYAAAVKNLSIYPNCTIVRKTSMNAVKDFEDESLDFIYIDGHHGFKYVTEDIYEWSKKIRKGGTISGHDYSYSILKKNRNQPYVLQVKYVVDAYTKAFNIRDWYVLGRKNKLKEGESRDQFRSWMWIKK